MPKKKLPQTIEECNAELERTQKQLQQYENRNKMLNRKLSAEKRKERNHRIFLYDGFMESIVPELKTMTEEERKDFLYHIAKSTETQEYLKKRDKGIEVGRIPLEQRAHFYTLLTGVCASCGAVSPDGQMSGLFCVALLRTRECLPCTATAAIPAHFAAETVCWRRPFPPQSLKIPYRESDRLPKT